MAGRANVPMGRDQRLTLLALGAIAIAVGAGVVLLGSSSSTNSASFTDSPYPSGDASNSRRASGSIRGSTVSRLEPVWSVPIEAKGGPLGTHRATPVVVGGVAFSQDEDSDVQAIDLTSGEIVWERPFHLPASRPNGLAVAGGRAYGTTPTAAFALDSQTGDELWSTPLIEGGREMLRTAPAYHDGLVYVSSAPSKFAGGEVGVLWALDARTGRKVWSFATVPRSLWGRPSVNYGGGVSYAPAFDAEGSMYIGVGNPGPVPGNRRFPWGSSRPGPNLYTDSVVKLDARTGKVQWHFQVTPHSLCNWEVISPLIFPVGGRKLVIAGSGAGVVVALDGATGRLVWKRSVGLHNGHDDDGLIAMRGEYSELKTPITVYPGVLGGVSGPLASNGSTVFASVVNHATRLETQAGAREVGGYRGEIVALDAGSGAVRWKHKLSSPPYSPLTTVNDLVLATASAGVVYALDDETGREVWSAELPSAINAGLAVSGDTVLAPAGLELSPEDTPELVAYRLSG
jgi:alcohol dehydrogenase (cytochrome c)